MIRNKRTLSRTSISLLIAVAIHLALFLSVKKDSLEQKILGIMNDKSTAITIDRIKVIKPEEVDKIRRVGIKEGKRDDAFRPDFKKPPVSPPTIGKKGQPKLSLDNLGAGGLEKLPPPVINKAPKTPQYLNLKDRNASKGSHFYFNPRTEKVIPRSTEQENLKTEAGKGFGPINKATENISNFEIRYERPEGVSEDELNSDEKAYYSFYVRSYKNYFAKIYSNYEKILIERPGLARAFDNKHLLIGKIDYDEKGNIITVKIIKSTENDDLHYFFEETLKELSQPNPPKVFTKNRKQFSIYYQIQIN